MRCWLALKRKPPSCKKSYTDTKISQRHSLAPRRKSDNWKSALKTLNASAEIQLKGKECKKFRAVWAVKAKVVAASRLSTHLSPAPKINKLGARSAPGRSLQASKTRLQRSVSDQTSKQSGKVSAFTMKKWSRRSKRGWKLRKPCCKKHNWNLRWGERAPLVWVCPQ